MMGDRSPWKCPWCGDSCPRWGLETCPLRPRQIPREQRPIDSDDLWRDPTKRTP